MLAALQRYRETSPRLVIGLMTGTSADAVDAALVEIEHSAELKARVVAYLERDLPSPIRYDLWRPPEDLSAPHVARLNVLLGIELRDAALRVAAKAGVEPSEVLAVGSHGQTVYHGPRQKPPCTLQIGEPAVIAAAAPWLVVSNFRPADVAVGGEGAPLTPLADLLLLRHPERVRIVQNIGGIANLTYLPAGRGCQGVIAFDTGPGNILLDAVARERLGQLCDRDGAAAAAGTPAPAVVDELLLDPFFSRPPPKSTGREEFGPQFAARFLAMTRTLSSEDALTTATLLTAESIARAYASFLPPTPPPDEVILTGGGAYNLTLRRMLAQRLPDAKVLTLEDLGLRSDAREAVAFAILADQTLLGQAGNLPAVTGGRRRVVLGQITCLATAE